MKAKIVLVSLLLSNKIMHSNFILKLAGFPILLIHRIIIEWFFCVEISWHARIGKNLTLWHPMGLVVHRDCVIGDDCTMRQNTTIGTKVDSQGKESRAPQLGHSVDIGSGVNIIGDINIGDNVIIGAGAVVVRNVPSNCVVAGNPAKVLRKN